MMGPHSKRCHRRFPAERRCLITLLRFCRDIPRSLFRGRREERRFGKQNMESAKLTTTSKTVTDTVCGEHTHTIVGYSLVKGIGDGEPIASERFSVGGHEWVLLFYPDGKRSSAELAQHARHAQLVQQAAGAFQGHDLMIMDNGGAPEQNQQNNAAAANLLLEHRRLHRERSNINEENEYAALFVALIGDGSNQQLGVMNTNDGKVVRAFHKFTLVNQTGAAEDFSKGRAREAGAVKISCARQDPNARNCHGYRKFIKRAILEDPAKGFLVDDTLIIKYSIDLVVTSGGALNKCLGTANTSGVRTELIRVPPPQLGEDLVDLLVNGKDSDVQIVADGETFAVHKIILESRSPVFRALLNSSFKEGNEGIIYIKEIKAPVLKVLLHFAYSDRLPDDLDDNMDCSFAQHLLEAADRFELNRLRKICEKRLCSTVEVDTVGTTLTLAEQNRADDLKKVCLDFVAKNLQAVLQTEGYKHMLEACPGLQADIIQTVASVQELKPSGRQHHFRLHNRETIEEAGRRVRQRRTE